MNHAGSKSCRLQTQTNFIQGFGKRSHRQLLQWQQNPTIWPFTAAHTRTSVFTGPFFWNFVSRDCSTIVPAENPPTMCWQLTGPFQAAAAFIWYGPSMGINMLLNKSAGLDCNGIACLVWDLEIWFIFPALLWCKSKNFECLGYVRVILEEAKWLPGGGPELYLKL